MKHETHCFRCPRYVESVTLTYNNAKCICVCCQCKVEPFCSRIVSFPSHIQMIKLYISHFRIVDITFKASLFVYGSTVHPELLVLGWQVIINAVHEH